jgi:uncharacterized protein (DUF433 family)
MTQLVIENIARQQILERVERLRDLIAHYHGPQEELSLRVVEELGELLPSLLDVWDAHLISTLNRYTALLKDEGLLKTDVEVVIRAEGGGWGDTFPDIERTPGVMGGAACVRQTRIPVWMIVQAGRLGMTDDELLRNYPTLTAEDLKNARAYADAHEEEVDREIRANEGEGD